MGKFRAEGVRVKHINNITIVFYNKETIYVQTDYGIWIAFHRWFAPKGSYREWEQFKHLLTYKKKITLGYIYEKALQYDIQSQVATRVPDLEQIKKEKKVVEI